MKELKQKYIEQLQEMLHEANAAGLTLENNAFAPEDVNDLSEDCADGRKMHGWISKVLEQLGQDTEYYFECGEWRETPAQLDHYIESQGSRCIYCRSTAIKGDNTTISQNEAYQDMECASCERSWTDTYTLSEITIHEEEQK